MFLSPKLQDWGEGGLEGKGRLKREGSVQVSISRQHFLRLTQVQLLILHAIGPAAERADWRAFCTLPVSSPL